MNVFCVAVPSCERDGVRQSRSLLVGILALASISTHILDLLHCKVSIRRYRLSLSRVNDDHHWLGRLWSVTCASEPAIGRSPSTGSVAYESLDDFVNLEV